MRVTFPPSTVCTTTDSRSTSSPLEAPRPPRRARDEHVLSLGNQLERLVADVLDHALEAREVAPRPLVAVVAVRLRRHVRRDHDHDLLVHHLERGLHAAAPVQLEQPPHDLDVLAHSRRARYGSDSVARVNEQHVHEVAIVGAGFGGLGMAIRLKQAGIEDFVLLERGADVGGTWWANSYPGAQCDIPSNLYSFSFAPKHDWETAYPMRDQILEYLRDCARRFDVLRHTRLSCELLDATWVAEQQHWELETSGEPLAARVLVAAPGLLSEPWSPELPGLDRFEGRAFHTARWDHGDDLTGKRVAVIGSGATAVQAVPAIQPRVGKLHLFQRTPPWVIPHMDHPVRPQLRELYGRVPALQQAVARRHLRPSRDHGARPHPPPAAG